LFCELEELTNKLRCKIPKLNFAVATILAGTLALGGCTGAEEVQACERLDTYLDEMTAVMGGWSESTDWSELVQRQQISAAKLIGSDFPDARVSETANSIEYLVFVDETVLGTARAGFSTDRSIEERKLQLEMSVEFLEGRPDAVFEAKSACRELSP
jgi:hypothetical protein